MANDVIMPNKDPEDRSSMAPTPSNAGAARNSGAGMMSAGSASMMGSTTMGRSIPPTGERADSKATGPGKTRGSM